MPSASTKVEIPASSEAQDPFRKVLNVVDKKVRNLEKRKLKLDAYKQKQDTGATLEKDQQVAVDKYGEVVQNLEFARDLQKLFQTINTDNEKVLKKQAKREKLEKQLQEMKRVKEVLQLQTLLDSMGSDSVRSDFQTGKHGAIVLTEENLEQIDEFYKLMSPTRDDQSNFPQLLSDASEHIVCLLDGRDKPVVGTTYKELKELLDLISNCGYFEKVKSSVEEPTTESTGDVEFEVVEHKDVPAPDSEEVQSSLPPELSQEELEPEPTTTQPIINTETLNTQQQPAALTAQADVFFTAVTSQALEQQQQQQQQPQNEQTPFNQPARPFQEIVSAVQGNFNFLQESTIEMEAKREYSPHMDPAVVAAHPMPQSQQPLGRPSSTQNPDSSLPQAGFGGASSFGEQSALDTDLSASNVDQSVFSQANAAPSQDFSGSGFTQSNLTHSLQTDNLFSGAVAGTDSNTGNMGMLGKSDNSTISHSQYDIPPQLPMPPGHDQSQDGQQSDAEKKGYPMNPNATEFQSLIYNQGGAEEGENGSNKSNTEGFQGGTYSNSGYNHGGPREQRSGSGRGGSFRGGRGGSRGSNNMSNGYSRGGRGNYQGGYQQRSDYNRSDNYQGSYNSGGSGGNSYNGGSFQKRGDSARGGSSRGGNRGGPRGGGFNRGNSSGGPRGASTRGTGQGFGRPNFNQQQQ